MKGIHFLGLQKMNREAIELLLERSKKMKLQLLKDESVWKTLADKKVVILFYESSTRTRLSFEVAALSLGANVAFISADTSSVRKGESLRDTLKTIEAMAPDCIIVRHPRSGALHQLAEHVGIPMVNAGDGMNEHPTQALLDMLTIQESIGGFEKKKVLLVGDILHSRVARSNIWGLTKLGADITVSGPKDWIPRGIESLGVHYDVKVERAIEKADAVIALRIQKERQDGGSKPSLSSYNQLFGVHEKLINHLDKKPIILHPGPVNRGIELTSEVMRSGFSRIDTQVFNGVAVRMAVLNMIVEGSEWSY